MKILEISNISKSYSQRGIVLDGLSLTAEEGDSIAIMGPSGSGKTTLMNIIGLLDRPDSGELRFRGKPISGYTEDEAAVYRNRNIGFVFQDHLLLPHLTVLENILLPLLPSDEPAGEKQKKTERAVQMMKITGIDGLARKFPSKISGGEAQRCAVVRALVNDPSIILADEPTGSLDSANAAMLGDLLTRLNRDTGITLIISTHSHELAARMKTVFRLEAGKLE